MKVRFGPLKSRLVRGGPWFCWLRSGMEHSSKTGKIIIAKTQFDGAFLIGPGPVADEGGFLARAFDKQEFEAYGLNTGLTQCNISFNHSRGTLRGMYFYLEPYAALVRCTRGAIYFVIIDLRLGSRTFMRWMGVQLNHENRWAAYVPGGFAQGYLTLEERTEVLHHEQNASGAEYSRGIRWNDPAFKIEWPIEPSVISETDRNHPDYPFERDADATIWPRRRQRFEINLHDPGWPRPGAACGEERR